jgi:LysR family transcriptional regulator, nitrogen assimilation regulatory protein
MDTRHLRAFLKIVETGSISRAAESLGLSQPSLSQQVLRLEDEAGVSLFRRTARGVVVTEAGRAFEEHARQILRNADAALAEVRHLGDEARGDVTLVVPPSLLRPLAVPLMRRLAQAAPQVRLRLVEAQTGPIRGWLERGQVDLGVLLDMGPLRNLGLRPLLEEDLLLVGGEEGDWTAAPLFVPGPQHQLRQLLDQAANRRGCELAIAGEVDSLDATLALVAAGLGRAVVPRSALDGSLPQVRTGLTRRLALARNAAQVVTHASLRVEQVLVDVLAELAGEGLWTMQENKQ